MAHPASVPAGDRRFDFRYAPTLRRAALDKKKTVRIVWGPVESGKTVWSLLQLYEIACTIPRCKDGIRRSRFLIVRSTEAELERGIMRTWKQLFPEDAWGSPQGSMPAIHVLRFLDVEAEFEFFAFEDDSEAVLKKLRSTEYTAALINEGQYTPLRLVHAIRQRTGRFPERVFCPDFDRKRRVVMDMNAPRTSAHWVLYMSGLVPLPADMPAEERHQYIKPDDWEIYIQPGSVIPLRDTSGQIYDFAINPDAENLPYQDPASILSLCKSGNLDDILRDYCNQVIIVKDGTPRYPNFRRTWHVAKERIEPVKGAPIILSADPGLTGAAVFQQKINGQWRALRELNAFKDRTIRGAAAFGQRMIDILRAEFPWHKETGVTCWGDPYGSWGTTEENTTFFNIWRELGLEFQAPAPKDNPSLRHEIGQKLINRGTLGEPDFIICPVGCPTLIDAIEFGCVMKQVKRQGEMVVVGELVKNNHSHIVEAVEYGWWGGGESISIIEKPQEQKKQEHRFSAVGTRSPFTYGTAQRTPAWSRR